MLRGKLPSFGPSPSVMVLKRPHRDVEMRDSSDIFSMWEKSSTNNASSGSGGSGSGSSRGAGSDAIFDPSDDIFAFMKMSGPVVSSSSSSSSSNVTGASGASNIIGSLANPLRSSSSSQPYPTSTSTSNTSTSADNFSETIVESVVEEVSCSLPSPLSPRTT